MLNEKAKELIAAYCFQKLRRGQRCEIPQLRADWWHSWRKSYGLSMRYPNRKFKVPLPVLRERLERSWLNVYRVRAACHALLGYDMEIENWDQSPFHHNETGSHNSKTLAIAGVNVPLVEGHDATRSRWTANFTCFSDKARLNRGGPPYMECMFRVEGGGERVKPQLEEHIRQRGYGKWVSASCSPSGSYKLQDILSFLERHLPYQTEVREWCIIMADDHAPHVSPPVAKLC